MSRLKQIRHAEQIPSYDNVDPDYSFEAPTESEWSACAQKQPCRFTQHHISKRPPRRKIFYHAAYCCSVSPAHILRRHLPWHTIASILYFGQLKASSYQSPTFALTHNCPSSYILAISKQVPISWRLVSLSFSGGRTKTWWRTRGPSKRWY